MILNLSLFYFSNSGEKSRNQETNEVVKKNSVCEGMRDEFQHCNTEVSFYVFQVITFLFNINTTQVVLRVRGRHRTYLVVGLDSFKVGLSYLIPLSKKR